MGTSRGLRHPGHTGSRACLSTVHISGKYRLRIEKKYMGFILSLISLHKIFFLLLLTSNYLWKSPKLSIAQFHKKGKFRYIF